MTCAVTTSFLGCLVTICLFFRYTTGADYSLLTKSILLFAFLLAGCVPLLVSYNIERYLGRFYTVYRYSLYFIFITCIIWFSLTIIRDVLWFTARLAAPTQIPSFSTAKNLALVNKTTFALSLLAAIFALTEGIKTPNIKNITLTSDKITSPLTIAVLSDIHIHRVINPQKVNEIISRTNAEKPDIILLAGDIIDDNTQRISNISKLLKNLKAPKGIYFVTGNHEFYAGYKATVNELKKLGFTFLENNGIAVTPEIYIAGIPDLFSAPKHKLSADITRAFSQSLPSQYRILISHTPADFKENNNFDLEVSGHTHGGQIFPFHIFVKLANKYLAGLYKMQNNALIYVSRGAGQWGPQMRFLAPAEISIIKLTPQGTK